jgi:alkylation response protein AidB-like acyl-CoA dehydrogenase
VIGSTDGDEIGTFRALVRAWFEERLRDASFAWSAAWTTRRNEDEYAFRRALARDLGARGWLFPTYPRDYGGGALTPDHQLVLEEEISRYGLRLSMVFYTLARIVAPCVLQFGTPEQRSDFLPPMTAGEVVVWQVLTEPQSGSDIANCRTTAIGDGTTYAVNGQKVMVGSHHRPDYLWTLVCTDPGGERHANLSWLYIPADLPGITIQPMDMLMGTKNAVFFDNVRVPAKYLIGGENNGWTVGHTEFELEHGGAGNVAADAAVQMLIDYCRREPLGSGVLLDDPETRDILADAWIESHICELFARRNFEGRLLGTPHPYGGAQYRYFQRMMRLHNAERVQAIAGYDGLMERPTVNEDDDLEHLVRAGPGQLHGGGTQDTDRLVIARRMGIGRASREEAPKTL